jgi:sulfate transport system permease protein
MFLADHSAAAGGLLAEGVRSGIAILGQELLRPEAVFALRMTLVITLFTVVINTGAGSSWLQRGKGKLPGRGLISALAELPMAVSRSLQDWCWSLCMAPTR